MILWAWDPLGLVLGGITISWGSFGFRQEHQASRCSRTREQTDHLLALFGKRDWYGLTYTPWPTWLITKKKTPNGDFPMLAVKISIELSPWRWVKMKLEQSFILCLFFSEYICTVRQHQDCKTVGPSCHLCFNFLRLHISPSRSRAPCSFTRSDAAHCPAFVPKKIDKCCVKSLSNQDSTEENCQLVWAFFSLKWL